MTAPAIIKPHSPHQDWLSKSELTDLTPSVLLHRLNEIKPIVAAQALRAEQQRYPVDEVIQAIRRTGVFYHFVPKAYGGLEFNLQEFIDEGLVIAEACCSTGWVTSFYMQHNFLAAQLPEAGQRDIFGRSPYTLAVGTASPPAQGVPAAGGFRVSGTLKYGSGAVHADWMQLVANVKTPTGASSMQYMMLPIEEVTVLDTWRVDGLAGTGSHDIVLRDVFVPESRTVDFEELRAGRGHGGRLYSNPIYRFPVDVLLNISSSTSAIGAARAAVQNYGARILEKALPGPDGKPVPKVASQMRLAEAELAAHTAELLLRTTARETQDKVESGVAPSNEERVRARSRIAYAVDLARHSVRIIFDGAGSSAHALSNPIQRAMRDVNMMASHAVYDKDSMLELWGKVLTGLASGDSFKHHSSGQAKIAAQHETQRVSDGGNRVVSAGS